MAPGAGLQLDCSGEVCKTTKSTTHVQMCVYTQKPDANIANQLKTSINKRAKKTTLICQHYCLKKTP